MTLTRRALLYGGAAALAAPALIRSREASGQTIPVGILSSLSGLFTSVGKELEVGTQSAHSYFTHAAGKPLEYVLLDDHGDPGRSVRLVQDAINERGVRYFLGTTNSAIALAVSKVVHALGGMNINLSGADEMTGSQCNRSTFRWPVASYSAAHATVGPFMAQHPDARRWYTITGQYVFGESLLRNTKEAIEAAGGTHIGNSYHPLSEREYSGYITTALAQQPDVLAICNFGSQTVDVLRQAVSFGMKRNTRILVMWSTGLDQFQTLGADTVADVYFGANYWHTVDTPANRIFRRHFEAAHRRVPSYLNASGWAVMQMLSEGLNAARTADVPAVIKALEGLSFEGLTGIEHVRAEDHQVVKPYYLMRGKNPADMADPDDFVDIIARQTALLPVNRTGCVMT